MAKAQIQTPEGVSIKLEGTPAEISAVLKDIKGSGKTETPKSKGKSHSESDRVTVPSLVEQLRTEGFFKKVKTMAEVKKRLADMGHTYPNTALSGPLRDEVRKRRLRRFKDKGKYVYAQ